jgi:hypothetical protein
MRVARTKDVVYMFGGKKKKHACAYKKNTKTRNFVLLTLMFGFSLFGWGQDRGSEGVS